MAKKKNSDISDETLVEESGGSKSTSSSAGKTSSTASGGSTKASTSEAVTSTAVDGAQTSTATDPQTSNTSITETAYTDASATTTESANVDDSIDTGALATAEAATITTDTAAVDDTIADVQGSTASGTQTTSTDSTDLSTSAASEITSSVSSQSDAESLLSDYYYTESDAVTAANAALAEYMANTPDEYTSTYQEQIDALLDEILNRDDFSYDFDADPLYQQYKNQYEHSALLAMQNAMAEASSITGGYGSSYAVQAASGAYQSEINQITDAMPELYQLAYSLYSDQGDTMVDNLSALSEQEELAQALYQDLIANYYTGLSASTTAAENAYAKDYEQYQDSVSYLQELLEYYAGQEQQSFENSQTQLEYELAVKEYEESIRQWEAELAASQSQWQAEFDASQAAAAAALASTSSTASTSSSTSSSGSTSSTSSTSSATTLSDTASDLKTTITQEMRVYAAEGASTAEINTAAAEILASYYRTGIITQEEANAIGVSYGATF